MSSRITSNMLSSNYLRNMRRNMSNMQTLQNQLASGKQIQKASDNPYVASRSMQLNAEISANQQYNENIKDTTNWLDTTDTALSQMGNVFGRIETLLVNAGNGAYDVDERSSIQDEAKEKVNELSQILNTSFDGSYIFGGTKTASKPTTVVDGVLQYADKNGKALTAYKKADGTITSSPTENTLVTLDQTGKDALTAEATVKASSDPRRAAECTALAGGATAYKRADGTITSSPTENALVTLSQTEKDTLTAEATAKVSSDPTRAAECTALAGGKTAYQKPDGTFTTSPSAKNIEVSLSLTNVTSLKKELEGSPTPDADRTDDILRLMYNTNTSAGGKSLADIKTLQATIKSTDTAVIQSMKDDATKALNAIDKTIPITQISTDLEVDISQGVKSNYNKTATDILEFTDKNGKTINVSELLNNIMTDLGTGGNISNITNTHLKDIQSVTANLLKQRSEVGSMQNRMDSAQTNNEAQNYNMTDILSKTEDIDFTETTMNYSIMQTVYTASLQISAKILPMTILNYL